MYQRQSEKAQPTCGYCGRVLGSGYYFTCHVCGATWCYVHKPDKCDHLREKAPPVSIVQRSKA